MKHLTGLTEVILLKIEELKRLTKARFSPDYKYIYCGGCRKWQGYKSFNKSDTDYWLIKCKMCNSYYVTVEKDVGKLRDAKYQHTTNKKGCTYDNDKYDALKADILNVIINNPGCCKQDIYRNTSFNVCAGLINNILLWLE